MFVIKKNKVNYFTTKSKHRLQIKKHKEIYNFKLVIIEIIYRLSIFYICQLLNFLGHFE